MCAVEIRMCFWIGVKGWSLLLGTNGGSGAVRFRNCCCEWACVKSEKMESWDGFGGYEEDRW